MGREGRGGLSGCKSRRLEVDVYFYFQESCRKVIIGAMIGFTSVTAGLKMTTLR